LFEQGIGFHEQGFSTRKWRAFRVEDGRSFGDAAIDVQEQILDPIFLPDAYCLVTATLGDCPQSTH